MGGSNVGIIVTEAERHVVKLSFANGQRAGMLTAREARTLAERLVKLADEVEYVEPAPAPPPRIRTRRRA